MESRYDNNEAYNNYIRKGLEFAERHSHPEAILQYENAIKINPGRPEAYLNMTKSLLEIGKTDNAINCFEKFLLIQPSHNHKHLHLKIAKALIKKGSFDNALMHLDSESKINPDCSETCLEKGKVYFTLKYYGMALQEFDKSIQKDQNNFKAMTWKGKDAIQEFEKAVRIKPDYIEAYVGKRDSIFALEEKAFFSVDKPQDDIAGMKTSFYEQCNDKAQKLIDLSRFNEAIELLDLSISIVDQCWESYLLKGKVLFHLKKYTEAIEQFHLVICLQPDYFLPYYFKGFAFYNQNLYNKAIEQFDIAISKCPDYCQSFYMKGIALLNLKKYDEAIENFEEVRKINRFFVYTYFMKAKVLQTLNDYDKAISQYDKFIKRSHNLIMAYEQACKALKQQGGHGEAEKIKEIKKSLNESWLLNGEPSSSLSRYEELLRDREFIIEIQNNLGSAHLNKGKCLFMRRRYEDALEEFEAAGFYGSTQKISFFKGIAIAHLLPKSKSRLIKNYECAISQFDKAIKIAEIEKDRKMYCPHVAKGIVLNKLGRYEEAIKELDNALEINPNLSSVYYNKYFALKSLNKIDEAEKAKRIANDINSKLTHTDHTSLWKNDSYPFKGYK